MMDEKALQELNKINEDNVRLREMMLTLEDKNRNIARERNELKDRVQELEAQKTSMNLQKAVECAAKELPEGWRIEITVERGAAWVTLFNSDGLSVSDEDSDCDTKLWEPVIHFLGLATQQSNPEASSVE